jgi:hypothetical protein
MTAECERCGSAVGHDGLRMQVWVAGRLDCTLTLCWSCTLSLMKVLAVELARDPPDRDQKRRRRR